MKKNDEYSYSFRVNKSKLMMLKEALNGENLDVSKFLRNAIDKKVIEYKISIDCAMISSSNLDCTDCGSYLICDNSPFTKRRKELEGKKIDKEIEEIFGGNK